MAEGRVQQNTIVYNRGVIDSYATFQIKPYSSFAVPKIQYFCVAPTVQLRCNFTLVLEQFTRTLEPFTRACIELLVTSVLLPTSNSRKIIR